MWGYNYYGQLGDGNEVDIAAPFVLMEDVKSVELGEDYSSAIKNDESLWVWGKISDESYSIPVKLMDQVKEFHGDYNTFAVVKTDDSLWMWGDNKYSQLTDKAEAYIDRESAIKIMDDVCTVSLNGGRTYALKNDGTLYAWGNDERAYLGTGRDTGETKPVILMSGVRSVVAGDISVAVIKEDGSLWMCGHNRYGELGVANGPIIYRPIKLFAEDQR